MRITIVQGAFLPVPPLRGGAIEKAWHALAGEFAARGHAVTHVSRLCDGLPAREELGGVRHIRIRGSDTPSRLWWLKCLDLAYSLRAVRVLPPADILVTHTFFMPPLARLRRGTGLLYVHVGRTPRGQMRFYRHAAALHVPSSTVADAVRAELGRAGPPQPAVPVIGYPVAIPSVEGVCREGKRILYAGRVHPEKGIDLLIDAFDGFAARHPGWTLRIVGPWDTARGGGGQAYAESLRSRAAELGGSVEFAGPVFDPAALAREYASASVFAYPSLAETGETFGLAALEAMAHGVPVVVSNLGCFRDFVRPGVNGLIFDHRAQDPSATLAGALAALVAGDPGRLREEARRTASAYTPSAIAELHLRDFESLSSHARAASHP